HRSPTSPLFPYTTLFRSTELWRTDGSPGGTGLFIDLNPGTAESSLSLIAASSTQLFFRANDGSSGDVLWRTDGSLGGTWPLPAVDRKSTRLNSSHLGISY